MKETVKQPLWPPGKAVYLHMTCWLILITYEMAAVYLLLGKIEKPFSYPVYYAVNILYFYGNVYILDLAFCSKKLLLKGAVLFLLLVLSYLLVKAVADNLLGEQHPTVKTQMYYIKGFASRNLVRACYFTILALFYWAAGHISFFRRQQEKAERQQLIMQIENSALQTSLAVSQNAYHQQQVNPHMLFNALNFVHNSIYKQSPDAANCVLLLTEMMRYSLEPTGADGKIPVEAETSQLEHLVEINRYRFDGALYIDITIEGDLDRWRIIPLILLTLAENVFKHGNLHDPEQPGLIELKVNGNGELIFHTRNLKKSKSPEAARQSIGLKNTQTRLQYAYPGRYLLNIRQPGEFYELTLHLTL